MRIANQSPFRTRRKQPEQSRGTPRAGVAAVEFAVVVPLLLSIVAGLIEMSRTYDVQNMLETAAREGGRFASIDRTDMLGPGQSANQKVIQDTKNLLASSGIPAADIQVRIRDAANPDLDFDLSNPANDLRLFQVQIDVPYSSVSYTPVDPLNDYSMSAAVTFRNGIAPTTQ